MIKAKSIQAIPEHKPFHYLHIYHAHFLSGAGFEHEPSSEIYLNLIDALSNSGTTVEKE